MQELLADRYQLGAIIGTGGMSQVYVATDTLLGREVAIKMLREDLARDANFRARFQREAQNSGKLNHPAIVAVYDTGETVRDGLSTPYIVMELVHGRTLRDLIRNDGPLSPQQAARDLVPVCSALQASHDAGIIHRDIKPGNIMITNTGAVKIMDFGIARALDDATSAMTQTSAVIGTAQYLSPEQARGKRVDGRSDIYALGCVFFECLTGKPPFEGETPFSVAYQHVQEDPPHPSTFISGLNQRDALNLDAVVLTAMAKHPNDRYQSAADMGEELQRLERNATTNAARPYLQAANPAAAAAGIAPVNPETAVLPSTEDTGSVPIYRPGAAPNTGQGGVDAPTSVMHAQDGAGPQTAHAKPVAASTVENPDATAKNRQGKSGPSWPKRILIVLFLLLLVAGGAYAARTLSDRSNSTEQSNASTVTIPNVAGYERNDAIADLEALGLNVVVSEEPNPDIERGLVISSNPSANSSVQKGATVTLNVSTGKEITETPDLSNLNTEDAAKKLAEAGLELDTVVQEESSTSVAAGLIVSQSPSPGSQVSRGSKVSITVSSGVPTQRVPVITGLMWDQAQSNLTSLGFQAEVVEVDSTEPAGTVLRVANEGQEVSISTPIRVEVSNAALFVMPQITNMTTQDAVAALRAAGWSGSEADLRRNAPTRTALIPDVGKIATQAPAAGQQVSKNGAITVSLYEFSLLGG